MNCNLVKDNDQKIRAALHDRLARKRDHKEPAPGDAVTYLTCDGEYHWSHYGWGPSVPRERWLTEAIREKCPDAITAAREEYVEQHGNAALTFETFIVSMENREAVAKIKGWARTNHKTMILYGATGRGKTHLARAVEIEFLKDSCRTAFVTGEALYELFIKAQPSASEFDLEAKQQLVDIRSADLLILDDLGAERQTTSGFFQEQLKKLLDEKHGRMIVTTNLPPRDLESRYNEKLSSRFMEDAISVPLRGRDYRRSV